MDSRGTTVLSVVDGEEDANRNKKKKKKKKRGKNNVFLIIRVVASISSSMLWNPNRTLVHLPILLEVDSTKLKGTINRIRTSKKIHFFTLIRGSTAGRLEMIADRLTEYCSSRIDNDDRTKNRHEILPLLLAILD